ncbi:threonine aldolase family protein [Stackebrandtia nassauensis]|uniref:Threonine aldolase n=1 Tax=Stackebrandtia nassauensis (strain DSM 44728 / CIP 108903 / NRRL B-16338 / NBRC 102104 / LLR-40K-21) TaxID=446470 RepID=D3QAM8_STANL|nr:GntG family PLP-dependent aldolase [Stackebrandtia nassauensis]ADD44674.1 Threonine aldolase [Stackebrandtia nassauensis DSM 44728]
MTVDLRSDTVTKPTPGMREAMATAEVGDDVYGEDPTVTALETEVAALLGKEAALFVPSGSMGNQIALQLLVSPGEELLADSDAHIVSHEVGAAAAIGGISTRTWPTRGGHLDVGVVEEFIRTGVGYHTVNTAAIAVENTHNRGGGTALPLYKLEKLRTVADERGLKLHLDGARLWHAHVKDGVPLARYGTLFDTVSVCLSKGLGAPVGSLVVADAEGIERARVLRKRMGGGMRQAGILAAAGRYALTHHLARLKDDHARAHRLAAALEPFGVTDLSRVQTNIILLRIPRIADFAAAAADKGVMVSVMSKDQGRLLTHLDVDDDGLDHAIKVLTDLLR